MVKLRLTRTGRKNHATYRVVAIDHRRARDSKALDYLGHYLPQTKEFKVDEEKVKDWMQKGAQPSATVKALLIKAGVLKKSAADKKTFKKAAGRKATERAEAKAAKAEEKKAASKEAEAEKSA